ncbi:MAG: L,D-transpeptidase family protein [Rhizobiaceae bacterium]
MRATLGIISALMLMKFGSVPAAASFAPESVSADDQLQIVISLNEQRLKVFRGNQTISESKISSGKPGHSTPTGIYSILHKKKFHRSNIYSNAPMPFMQRLTWTGIALHGSDSVPNYPASHGCVRLPDGFDEELFGLTSSGAHVLINGDMVLPQAVSHETLPRPSMPWQYKPAVILKTQKQAFLKADTADEPWKINFVSDSIIGQEPSELISEEGTLLPVHRGIVYKVPEDEKPLRILITRRNHPDQAREMQAILNKLGFNAGDVDGLVGRDTRAAIRRFQEANELPVTGSPTPEVIDAIYKAAGKDSPPNAILSVRQNFEPVFEAPVRIDDPKKPIGTHLLVTTQFDRKTGKTGWNVFTLENRIGDNNRALLGIDPYADTNVRLSEALDRIHISEKLRKRLATMMTPGTSLTITDNGTERYTGWKTDFVVNTRIERNYVASVAPRNRATRTNVRSQRRTVRTANSRRIRYQRPGYRQPRYQRYQRPRYRVRGMNLFPIFDGFRVTR